MRFEASSTDLCTSCGRFTSYWGNRQSCGRCKWKGDARGYHACFPTVNVTALVTLAHNLATVGALHAAWHRGFTHGAISGRLYDIGPAFDEKGEMIVVATSIASKEAP